MLPSLLTKREAAERSRLCVSSLNVLIRDGRGPALTMLGGKALIREDALAQWIEARTERPAERIAA